MLKQLNQSKDSIKFKDLIYTQNNLKKMSHENLQKLKRTILKDGLIAPFLVFKDKDKKVYILDGHARWKAINSLVEEEKLKDDFEANVCFVKCKGLKEAREFILKISSQYHTMTQNSLINYSNEFDIDIKDLDINFGGFNIDKFLEDDEKEKEEVDKAIESSESLQLIVFAKDLAEKKLLFLELSKRGIEVVI